MKEDSALGVIAVVLLLAVVLWILWSLREMFAVHLSMM